LESEDQNNVIVLCTEGKNSKLLVDFLSKNLNVKAVFIEPPESRIKILKRRIKSLGFFKALGQVAFQLFILPFIRSKNRTNEILSSSKWNDSEIKKDLIHSINSVNEIDLEEIIKHHSVHLIFINGTKIITKKQLAKINIPILNIHVGITPQFRGVHGGYWALREEKPDLFGVTLHLVDQGIDTGGVIAQKVIETKRTDNFKTYPLLQYLGGIALIEENLNQIKKSEIKPIESITKDSKLHSHPTFWQYLVGRMRRIK
jgi:methionyl-tRNA formyltransferase